MHPVVDLGSAKPLFEIFIIHIILKFVSCKNSDASKLCSVVSDESFVSFHYINELNRKKACFLQSRIHRLSCDIIEILIST